MFGAAAAAVWGWMQSPADNVCEELQEEREILWSWIPGDGALGQQDRYCSHLYWEKPQEQQLAGFPAEL